MFKFRQLEWHIRSDGVVHADPIGLQYSYYIAPIENSKNFELALIENNGNFDEKMCTTHDSMEFAQKMANKHYINTLLYFFNLSYDK